MKSKAGVESLVLPLEFPDGGNGACAAREVGKGVIDWNGVEKSKLIDTNIELGPFWNLTFDLFIYSLPRGNPRGVRFHPSATLLAYQRKSVINGDCMICIILHKHHARNTKHTPWGQKPVLLFYWNGRMGYREGRKEVKNLKIKEWFTVEFSRHQLKKKVMREAVKKEKSFIIITIL